MKLLLDTHTFLWFIRGSLNLSDTVRDLIEDRGNQRFLSIASLWEMSIKVSIGKLELDMTLTKLVKQEIYGNAIELPDHHLERGVSIKSNSTAETIWHPWA